MYQPVGGVRDPGSRVHEAIRCLAVEMEERELGSPYVSAWATTAQVKTESVQLFTHGPHEVGTCAAPMLNSWMYTGTPDTSLATEALLQGLGQGEVRRGEKSGITARSSRFSRPECTCRLGTSGRRPRCRWGRPR